MLKGKAVNNIKVAAANLLLTATVCVPKIMINFWHDLKGIVVNFLDQKN